MLSFSFFVPRHPPSSTLFPYTTLFRSDLLRPPVAARVRVDRHQLRARGQGRRDDDGRAAAQLVDRKSTRLNSSHGYISYAVFCLKKKRPTTRPLIHRSERRWYPLARSY